MKDYQQLPQKDAAAHEIILKECLRQNNHLEMIASENYASAAVMEASGSSLANKYAEGYPGKRYYSGCSAVDEAENLAIERAKTLFGAAYANVQPHSGAQANMAVYFSFLNPGDKILAMNLAHGGHLTHGSAVNFSGKLYQVKHYGVDPKTHLIDYDLVLSLAQEHRPKMIVCGASAYPRSIDFEAFARIAEKVDAVLLADMAHISGLVAAEEHLSPIPFCDVVTSTTQKTLRGPRGGIILSKHKKLSKQLNAAVFPGMQGGPMMHTILAKAVAFGEAQKPSFRNYIKSVKANAQALAKELQSHGFELLTGGTDNHLLLLDLRNKNLTGKDAEAALNQAGIACNKNMIPDDPQSPFVTSGVRLGTPALTSRGMGLEEMQTIAKWIKQALSAHQDQRVLTNIEAEVKELCHRFPVHPEL